jgi:hypothetical protein
MSYAVKMICCMISLHIIIYIYITYLITIVTNKIKCLSFHTNLLITPQSADRVPQSELESVHILDRTYSLVTTNNE